MENKKLIIMLVGGYVAILFAFIITAGVLKDTIKYDLTGDGKVNSADMLELQKYIIGQEHKYDVNQDGIVDERDYIEIKEYVMGE